MNEAETDEPDVRPGDALDFGFLDAQTFGDAALVREVLSLFAEQARRLVPRLPDLDADEQTATAHLLKGSCQSIGAAQAADLLQAYGLADAPERRAMHAQLSRAFAAVEAAIATRLAAP